MSAPLRHVALGLMLALSEGCRSERSPDGLAFALTAIGQLMAPGLVTFDDASRAVPALAESFRAVSPTVMEFTLHAGLTFQ